MVVRKTGLLYVSSSGATHARIGRLGVVGLIGPPITKCTVPMGAHGRPLTRPHVTVTRVPWFRRNRDRRRWARR